jgi:acylphosphatase
MSAMKKKPQLPTHRARAFYSGRVQGVGFRHTAEQNALAAALTGWVKNLPDGRVELVCEGSKDAIDGFLAEIKTGQLGPYIKKTDVRWEPPTCEFTDFTVEFHL